MQATIPMTGMVLGRVTRAPGPGLAWKLSNLANLWHGWWRHWVACRLGVGHFYGTLHALLTRADGTVINYGLISTRVITDVGVAFLVDDWDNNTTDFTDMNYHACGTGVGAEGVAEEALGAEATTITDRGTGAKTQPAANQLRSVGTQAFTDVGVITEHGIFSDVAESAGVLWDRSMFAAINVANGDSIAWTYTCTVSAGG